MVAVCDGKQRTCKAGFRTGFALKASVRTAKGETLCFYEGLLRGAQGLQLLFALYVIGSGRGGAEDGSLPHWCKET